MMSLNPVLPRRSYHHGSEADIKPHDGAEDAAVYYLSEGLKEARQR